MFSSSSASSASQSFSSISSSIASDHATTLLSTSSSTVLSTPAADDTPPSESEVRAKAQVVVARDLKTWQEKFAKAADEGSDELEVRITEITDRLVQNQAQGVGKALIIQLEETVKSQLKTLKNNIISIVKADDGKASPESEETLNTAVRKAGVAIKDKALAVRTWRQSYDRETNSLVSKAASDTFEIIDLIRDSGLQEIGMRWAWTDGITHKDWTKYHQLKTKFDEWRLDVEKVVTEHPGLEKARLASEEVETKAMEIAEDAAKELARLKETGRWKLSSGDSSTDFSTKLMPPVVAAAGQKILDKVSQASEAVAGTSQGMMESVASVAGSSASSLAASAATQAQSVASDVSKSAVSVASSVSSSIIGTSQGSVESIVSVVSASASSVVDKASSSVIGTSQGSLESVASVVSASASSAVDKASSSVIGTSQGSLESVVSVVSASASSLSAKASSSVIGTEPGFVEKASDSVKSAASVVSKSASSLSDAATSAISSGSSKALKSASEVSKSISSASSSVSSSVSKSASEVSNSASSAASSASSTASKKVWGGAMAQFVEARQIIYEDIVDDSDDESFSEKLASLASQAGDSYSDITKAVSEAFLKSTSSEGQTITKLAKDKYSSAISAASVALYGTEQGTGESISSVASSRYHDAVSA